MNEFQPKPQESEFGSGPDTDSLSWQFDKTLAQAKAALSELSHSQDPAQRVDLVAQLQKWVDRLRPMAEQLETEAAQPN